MIHTQKNIYLTLIAAVITAVSFSQDLSMDYYSYLYNPYNINPAYCAQGDKLSAILNMRQRAGLNSSNAMMGLKGTFDENQGFGGRIISDTRGAFQITKVDLTYGNKLQLNDRQNFCFGLSTGLLSKSFNISKIKNFEQLDVSDPMLQNSNLNSTNFTVGAGMIYNIDKFTLGISSPHLMQNSLKMTSSFIGTASFVFKVNNDFKVTPLLYYFNQPVLKNYSSIQIKADYKNLFWLQTGFQTNSVFNFGAGIQFGKLGFGYGYLTPNNFMKGLTTGTHEIVLTLKLKSKSSHEFSSITKPTSTYFSNQLSAVIDSLNALMQSAVKDKKDIRNDLLKIKMQVKNISESNIISQNPENLDKLMKTFERRMKEAEWIYRAEF